MATHHTSVTIRQYERERVIECLQTGLLKHVICRLFLQLSKIPHYTTLQNLQIESI